MTETATLTIRLDETLKKRVEDMAEAEDRSTTEYVVRALKERLDVQCPSCGRSSGINTLPVGLTPAFQKWLADGRSGKAEGGRVPFYITVNDGGQRSVYWGNHRAMNKGIVGAVPMDLFLENAPSGSAFGTSIPLGVITGWNWDMDGNEYRRLLAIGYGDGNEAARRYVQKRLR